MVSLVIQGDFFGAGVDMAQNQIIIGAPSDDTTANEAGAAYIFSNLAMNGSVILNATATPNILFPPNHKFIPITVSVETDSNGGSCRIVSVSSNEATSGTGLARHRPIG